SLHDALDRLKSVMGDQSGYVPVTESPAQAEWWRDTFQDYFAGGNPAEHPETVPLDSRRWTPFQSTVYMTLRDEVKWGETISYGDLAALAGFPGAARAVGTAMAGNTGGPFIPCHRVIGARGQLGGYSGIGGLDLKKRLLEHERLHPRIRSGDPEHP
ncbi:MAG TPA: MGMT family protein, partial [bacterium]|nr:MGMT family protein [bacterium]